MALTEIFLALEDFYSTRNGLEVGGIQDTKKFDLTIWKIIDLWYERYLIKEKKIYGVLN